ncbi:MAG: hypothetical protein JNM91_13610 [Flavobacteriales bacterium]|nr:hypothetical protein [Flavobacteriales bacterium]
MTFGKRLRLFMLGIGLGTILSFLFFGKGCTNMAWAPEGRVRLRMKSTLIHAAPAAQAQLTDLHLDLATLRAQMDSCDVDFSASRRTDDSLYYAMSGRVAGHEVAFDVAALRDYTIDSTATLLRIVAR